MVAIHRTNVITIDYFLDKIAGKPFKVMDVGLDEEQRLFVLIKLSENGEYYKILFPKKSAR